MKTQIARAHNTRDYVILPRALNLRLGGGDVKKITALNRQLFKAAGAASRPAGEKRAIIGQ